MIRYSVDVLPLARWFVTQALEHSACPTEVSTDRAPAYPRRQLRRREEGWEDQLMQIEVEWRDRSPMLRHRRHSGQTYL